MPGTEIVDGAEFFANERLKWPEKTFQKEVLNLARDLGWDFAYHTYFSDRSEKGYPDIHLLRTSTGESIFIELKSQKGTVKKRQAEWLLALAACGQRCYLWRPSEWNSGEIQRVLEGKLG